MSKKIFDDPAQQLFKPRARIFFFKYFVLVFFIIIGVRFWFLQIVQHDHYVRQAENNRVRDIPIPAPRGAILDREGRVLVDSSPSYAILLYQEDMVNREETTSILVNKLGADPEALLKQMESPGSRSRPILVKANTTPADRAWIEAHEYEHPEIKVELQPQRRYPYKEVLAHALGYVREISEDQLREPDYDYCKPGDIIGQAGLEKTYNKLLMGREGSKRVVVDSRGRVIQQLEEIPPIPGQDIVTTIDLDIQMVAENALTASGLNGTIVINDPRDGGIRAMVSHPAYDPNLFSGGITPSEFKTYYTKLLDDPKKPLRNRAIQDRHPPGSTWKILMATAAMEEKLLNEKSTLPCGGGISIGSRFAQCLGNHGAPDIQRAIEVSCNGFFYRCGLKLGIDVMEKWQKLIGVGMKTGIDLPSEIKGIVPSREWKRKEYPSDPKWRDGDTINAAIGQSGVRPTPLQMMYAIAGIGMGGKFYTPHLFKDGRASENYKEVVYEPKGRDLHFSEETRRTVQQGLWRVVNGAGTARRAQVEGFDVCGKTGTAQVVSVKSGASGDQKEHAWFVGYAPKAAPEIGGVALVEHGGHGGTTAAPIIKACFEEYKRKRDGLPKQEEQLAQGAPKPAKPAGAQVRKPQPPKPSREPLPGEKPPAVRPPATPATQVAQPRGTGR
jgi:penicillin-binding protein 2